MMRFTAKLGDKKTIRKFLFWPQGNDGDVRWLEWATVEYERTSRVSTDLSVSEYWKPMRFSDEQT